MEKIAIIGAGFAGLSTAKLIQQEKKDAEITIFEASDRIGGLIRTTKQDRYVMEWGPEAFMTSKISVSKFLEKTNLKEKIIPATKQVKKRFVVHKGKVKALPGGPISALTTRLIPLRTKIGIIKEPFVRANCIGEESFSSFINRRLGKGLDPIIDAFVSGVYGGDHTKLSVNYAFPGFKNLEIAYGSIVKGAIKGPRARKKMMKAQGIPILKKEKSNLAYLSTFKGGLTDAVNFLAEGMNIKTSTPVEAIIKNNGSKYTLKTSNGQFEADKVIFAGPPNAYLKLDTTTLHVSSDRFNVVDEAVVNVVSLIYNDSQFKKELEGYGFLSPSKENLFSLGVLFVSDIFPEHAPEGKKLLRCFIGGIRNPEKSQLSDHELIEGAKEDVRKLLYLEGNPELAFVARNRGLPQLNLGHKQVIEYKNSVEKENKGLFITGVGWTGISTEHLMKEAENIVKKIIEN